MSQKKVQERVVLKIKEYLAAEKMTQAALAKKLGWSPSDLNDVLRGRKSVGWKRIKHLNSIVGDSICDPGLGPPQGNLVLKIQKAIEEVIGLAPSVEGRIGAYRRYGWKN